MSDRAFTPQEKLAEIERELAIRERFYPGWVHAGKITAARAQKQIALLREIAADLRKQCEETTS